MNGINSNLFFNTDLHVNLLPNTTSPSNSNETISSVAKEAIFINSSQDSGERGKAGSQRSGLNEEAMAKAMADEEERSGKAAASRVPDEIVKVAAKEKPRPKKRKLSDFSSDTRTIKKAKCENVELLDDIKRLIIRYLRLDTPALSCVSKSWNACTHPSLFFL